MKKAPISLAVALVVLLSACGGGETTTTTTTTEKTTPAPTEPSATAPAEPTASAPAEPAVPAPGEGLVVKMGSDTGQLVFVPAKLTVKPGDKIVWLMNKAGPHNAVFDANVPDPAAAKAMALTKLLSKPGDKLEVTVPANAKPGDYAFNCTPHKSAGMVGVLTVQK
ncbi:plastocyanin [Gloeobacter morelensis]|uniref:Plastocyanin n=1 Tax=Gloeobacter morelensis MG652769 TaxID=2781736 RepID=A0ABY3PQF9_9CYAN|nr:plastocyanin [Gloeobacter morelensis]UFP95871.1 plastocyanin [Gloeobacter morelensis MG652769]